MGDGLFHVGLIRKLETASGISFASLSPFLHGPANAGYAFPIMHAAMAGMARLSGTDPVTAFRDVQPMCAGLAIMAAYALGHALTGRRGIGLLTAVLVGWDMCSLLNGLVIQINQPAPFGVWVLTPAVLILFLLELRRVRRAAPATVAAMLSIALVHPTYAIPALVLAAGLLAGAVLAGARALRRPVTTLLASTGAIAAVSAWIWAIAIRGGHRHPVLSHADEFLLHGKHAIVMYPWAPVFGRGYVLAAILLLPLVARHRRLLPLAGSAGALLLILLVPGVNTALITAVGMGQFHRFWQPLTWPVVAAAAACISRPGCACGRTRSRSPSRSCCTRCAARPGCGGRPRACSSCVRSPPCRSRCGGARPPGRCSRSHRGPSRWSRPCSRRGCGTGGRSCGLRPRRARTGPSRRSRRCGSPRASSPPSAASTGRRRSCWAIPSACSSCSPSPTSARPCCRRRARGPCRSSTSTS